MAKKETHMTEDAKLYELGFHIVPTAGEEKATEAFSVIKEIISKNGEVVKSADPKAMKLAYTIIKKIGGKNTRFDESYFAWIKFTASSESIESIKEEIDSNEEILRYIIVKTVDDDEHSTAKLVQEEEEEIREIKESDKTEEADNESEESEEKTESEDELDKAIDDLVEEK
jgi:ribosomal protein S6